jgi:hypothetical protein
VLLHFLDKRVGRLPQTEIEVADRRWAGERPTQAFSGDVGEGRARARSETGHWLRGCVGPQGRRDHFLVRRGSGQRYVEAGPGREAGRSLWSRRGDSNGLPSTGGWRAGRRPPAVSRPFGRRPTLAAVRPARAAPALDAR